MKRIVSIDPAWGITVVRISTGLIFVVHRVQKFATGLGGVTAFFAKVGIPAPDVMGPFVAILELVGGILLIVGLRDPLDWSPLRHRDARYDAMGPDSKSRMDCKRPRSSLAGVEPAAGACRWREGERRCDLARERSTGRGSTTVTSTQHTTKRQSPYLSPVYLGEGRSLRIGAQLVPALRCGGRRRRTEGLGHRVGMARDRHPDGLDTVRPCCIGAQVSIHTPALFGVARISRHTMRPMPRMTSSV
jgi:DoxX